ncbi:MAG TPA: aspartate aminotransferase [Elusimicrobia bacterium]|nr:MAG: aspartate aminotransferase [Elusimicrobia bacterium RIFOXYA12_FULL_49_49]OGS06546.1 MAG: aspartate aminotransferase [Elusimicrobia bacterium RIFOXYA1_FULL_47_7]OGS09295.1 MAG: aspartate aminotransferase [Elusimicrobia bacterium RIFOXYB1_FULL_48_9]OGS14619.1 MAG: aspartate aminotransferase [Elusimicrobia bacterium RIFOXYA2_FULL_47_53]OGS25728.1 MAG: aspartate aminotransferase [Elusimicrobia bacterium RIFOXYB12_FULL_50_12]OGS31710.1 MAG: aspartate aminotransferase [Elusimicrobia bacteriu
MFLSQRVQAVKPSATLAIEAKAQSLKAQGIDIVSFGAGEPDFDTPANIKDAAIKAINSGFTKYCPVTGTPDLKQAIINKFKAENSLEYTPEEIIVSCGAKHSLYNLFQAIFNPGDELLIPAPYWVSYPDMAILAGAVPKFIATSQESGFKVKPEQIEKAVSKQTKAIVINSPSNPTGGAYSLEELKAIAEVCVKHKILIISDEIYEKLIFDNFKFASIASVSPEAKALTVVVNGVSKAFAMTGWRIGYAAGPKEIIAAMGKIQSQSTSNPTSISLKASTEALNGPKEDIEKMRVEFEKRRNYIVDRLNKIPGVSCLKPQGAFYVFPNVSGLFGKSVSGQKINSSLELAQVLLEKAKIAVVPGEPFGAPGFIRLSYATSIENIKKGLDRFEEAVK